ncbi:MnmC family methyltransferase [Stenotrophomonas lacuserhaii]|uniref:class I SAM-dependent methyltransferase n=1 Tax=Stenotrophomonas lacuserhaii TaxID=2760084 RepID=UPI0032EC4BD3
MPHYSGPLLTRETATALQRAADAGAPSWAGSLDLGRSEEDVGLSADGFIFRGQSYPWPGKVKDRTLYYWDGEEFLPISRFSASLIKLVPTEWGAPTFEIDGIKMLPSAKLSPFDDARRKVELIAPAGKTVLDTCGGLGYFAACCLDAGVVQIRSFEKNPDVLWLRTLNPWSPDPDAAGSGGRLQLAQGDVSEEIAALPSNSVDAILHDPPRFGIAGELYSQVFYDQLARVMRSGGKLFHYTGAPNKLTSGRDVPREVAKRLEEAGFKAEPALDGVLATYRG